MKNIESYNSSYPLAYYEIGTVYSFYGQLSAKGTPAPSNAIQKYASILNALVVEEHQSAIKPVKSSVSTDTRCGKLNRFYAIVIEKLKSGNNAYIVVMLCNKHNGKFEYYTRKYSVNYGCATDGKDLMPTTTHLDFESKINSKVGGITLVGKNEKVGGVTRANSKNTSTASVGGITKIHQTSSHSTGVTNTSAKIGGVTLVREQKVGGITRAKK